MSKRRTKLKNALKRRKRRLERQIDQALNGENEQERVKEQLENEYMENEENSQRCHEAWIAGNAKSNAIFAKKQKIKEERERLMETIKQQVEQEKMEQEIQEKERMEAMESLHLERQQVHDKQQKELLENIPKDKIHEIVCSFYARTGICRFGANCTRYHRPFDQSRFVLIKGMYSIQMAQEDDLEIDDKALQHAYKEFYNDALAEFVKYGFVVQLTTCCNLASHLRGNVYVEYQTHEQATAAVQGLFGRFYAGKQLYPTLTPIENWSQAICGLYQQKRCLRGRECNFLHPFKTPIEKTPSYPYRAESSRS
ncbi:u2 small nuclear ribonucleoprotein auxiliary factor 35 kDa subunit-related protein 2-like, partial [Thraustotheca clavata]